MPKKPIFDSLPVNFHRLLIPSLFVIPQWSLALDANQNGISDVWESLYPAATADLSADHDGDGVSNEDEGAAWTNPDDANSFLKPENFQLEAGTFEFDFKTQTWLRYNVQESDDLLSWTRQGEAEQSDGSPKSISTSAGGPQDFYSIASYNALNSDTDSLTNKEEELLGTNPETWDSDGDRVADDIEFLNGTNPLARADTDGDGIDDDFERWCINSDENDHFTDLTDINATTDFDQDSIPDGQEFTLGTSPVTPLRNVLFFITEDQSLHLGLYDTNPADGFAGDSATPANNRTRGLDTPHLDALGSSGVVFDRAFCLSPVCSPSKMALYTGTFPHTNSAHRNVRNWKPATFPIPNGTDPSDLGLGGVHEDLPTLIEIFRERGWYTALSSKLHVQPVRKFPYDAMHPNLGTPAAAANAMDDVITQAGDRPFFFWANLGSPHLPFKAVPTSNGAWSGPQDATGKVTNIDANAIDVPNCYPDVPSVRQDIADYLGNIKIIDGIFQACVDKLDERGVRGETVIIFTSDHGLGLHRAKQSIYSAGLHIPFLISGPGVSGGRRLREPVSHLDLAPTLLDLVGSPKMPSHSGRSLWPLLDGSQNDFPDRKTMLTACHRYYNARAVCDGRYYYVNNLTQPTGGTLANPAPVLNADQYTSGSPWFNRTYSATVAATGTPQHLLLKQIVEGGMPEEELFDLDADLWCTNNLANDPSLANIKNALKAELAQWRKDTEDYNLSPSEMTRRTERFTSIHPPSEPAASVDFESLTGNLDASDDWTTELFGNNNGDFTVVANPFAGGGNALTAAPGPLMLASYAPVTLSAGQSFTVSLDVGFPSAGIFGGIVFGHTNSSNWFSFELGNGNTNNGVVQGRLFRIRERSGGTFTNLLFPAANSLPLIQQDRFYRLTLSGVEGSSDITYQITDPSSATTLAEGTHNLGSPVPADSQFGLTANSSNSTYYDNLVIEVE